MGNLTSLDRQRSLSIALNPVGVQLYFKDGQLTLSGSRVCKMLENDGVPIRCIYLNICVAGMHGIWASNFGLSVCLSMYVSGKKISLAITFEK